MNRTPEVGTYEHIAVADILIPAAPQPFDAAAMADLTRSIQAHGVLEPVLLRPGGRAAAPGELTEPIYELVHGARRWRAAVMAGEHTIPAVVVEMSDETLASLRALRAGRQRIWKVDFHGDLEVLAGNEAEAIDMAWERVGAEPSSILFAGVELAEAEVA